MKGSNRHHREDPVQTHTPPSSASSSTNSLEGTRYQKEYVDPVTGKYVEETIIETRDPNNKHRRIRKHKVKRRSSRPVTDDEGVAATTTTRGSDPYGPPPQAVYPGDSVSSRGRRSRRSSYDSYSGSDRSISPQKRGNSLSRALAKIGLAGAAAEMKHKYDERRSRSRARSDYATTDASSRASSVSRSRSRSRRNRHLKEGAIIGAGALAAEHEHRKHKREKELERRRRSHSRQSSYCTSDSDSDRGSRHRRRRRHSDSDLSKEQREQAAKTALATAAIQAFRNRKLPGGIRNEQGVRRIVEAAIASGAIELMMNKRNVDENKKRRMVEAIIGGLVSQRVLEGSTKNGHFVARPHHVKHVQKGSGPGLAELAAGGAAIYAGKKFYDRSRSRSRKRLEDRSASSSPDRHGRPRINRRRSKSIPALLGAVGLGSMADDLHHKFRGDSRSRSRSRSRGFSDNSRRRTIGLYERDRGFDNPRDPGDGVRGDGYAVAAPAGYAAMPRSQTMPAPQGELQEYGSTRGGGQERETHKAISEMSDDDPELPESELKKRRKKKKQREVVTAALAVLGVIGAAQKLYEGQEAHKLRREMVIEGEISKEEAAKKRRKAKMKEGAAIGLAALALWEMYDDGKKAYENHKDRICFEESCRKRHNRVGEHVGDSDKQDGKPSGERRQRKQKKLMAGHGGENDDYYDPNVQYAQYPDGPPVTEPSMVPGGARGVGGAPGVVPVAPAYPAGTVPVGGYAGGPGPVPVYTAPPVARATMKDGRQMTVVYPDHVSQVG